MNRTVKAKEMAVDEFAATIGDSWSWHKLTTQEQADFLDIISTADIRGTYEQRYGILRLLYRCFLAGANYSPLSWREKRVFVDAQAIGIDDEQAKRQNEITNELSLPLAEQELLALNRARNELNGFELKASALCRPNNPCIAIRGLINTVDEYIEEVLNLGNKEQVS